MDVRRREADGRKGRKAQDGRFEHFAAQIQMVSETQKTEIVVSYARNINGNINSDENR